MPTAPPSLAVLALGVFCAGSAGAQQFADLPDIGATCRAARSVFAGDIDGDGDRDVLVASRNDNKIGWYENIGGELRGHRVIDLDARGAWSVFGSDLDGDGDLDAVAANSLDNQVAWYENLGGGAFAQGSASRPGHRVRAA